MKKTMRKARCKPATPTRARRRWIPAAAIVLALLLTGAIGRVLSSAAAARAERFTKRPQPATAFNPPEGPAKPEAAPASRLAQPGGTDRDRP